MSDPDQANQPSRLSRQGLRGALIGTTPSSRPPLLSPGLAQSLSRDSLLVVNPAHMPRAAMRLLHWRDGRYGRRARAPHASVTRVQVGGQVKHLRRIGARRLRNQVRGAQLQDSASGSTGSKVPDDSQDDLEAPRRLEAQRKLGALCPFPPSARRPLSQLLHLEASSIVPRPSPWHNAFARHCRRTVLRGRHNHVTPAATTPSTTPEESRP